ncbi:hypothetical protein EI74_0800 [Mycoplasma testudineum]|uniref:Uncharacterized protein n=1 Tax=Mycoplasma testudineum TaxID=244584 RepID=A0A4R6IAR0_9MOLU|nr:hypothetical protein [Mycoplasma testudineum]OYD26494.1 hypothetical protein CG473_03570 [Mycoplasma testudineum]TDO18982.1 hypothetical protein EI74_0800 [Mycoplasma testudineum]
MKLSDSQLNKINSLKEKGVENYNLNSVLMYWLLKYAEYNHIKVEFRMRHVLDNLALKHLEYNLSKSASFPRIETFKVEINDVLIATKKNINLFIEEIIYMQTFFIPKFVSYGLIGINSNKIKLYPEFKFRLFFNISSFDTLKNYKNKYFENFSTNNEQICKIIFDDNFFKKISSIFSSEEKKLITILKDEKGIKAIINYSRTETDAIILNLKIAYIHEYDVLKKWNLKSDLILRCIHVLELLSDRFEEFL